MHWIFGTLLLILITVVVAKLVSRVKILEVLSHLAVFILIVMTYLKLGLIKSIVNLGTITGVLDKIPGLELLVAVAGGVALGNLIAKIGPLNALINRILPF